MQAEHKQCRKKHSIIVVTFAVLSVTICNAALSNDRLGLWSISTPALASAEAPILEPIQLPKTQTAAIPNPEPSPLRQYAGNVVRGLLIVTLVLIVGARLYKAYLLKQEQPAQKIKITSRRSISPKSQLIIAEIDGAEYLLALNQDGVSLLSKLEPQDVYCSNLSGCDINRGDFSEQLLKQETRILNPDISSNSVAR